jgi:MOSC domain-containing protein YiiM
VNVSRNKGERKKSVASVRVTRDYGIESDAHAGSWHRQVSLLAMESIEKMRARGVQVGPGDFAENLTTEGLELIALPLGTLLRIGEEVEVEVTQIGKECHDRCAIYAQAGDCVMPREGIFVRVRSGGIVRPGDTIRAATDGTGHQQEH